MPDAAREVKTHEEKEENLGDEEAKIQEDLPARVEDSPKGRSVSFNRDVHVKRIAPSRGALSPSGSGPEGVRRESLVGLSRQQLAQEAARVLHQASSTLCSSTQLPDRFYSLPNRRKNKQASQTSENTHNRLARRRSEDLGLKTQEAPTKTSTDRFLSLPNRRKNKPAHQTVENTQNRLSRRKSDDLGIKNQEPTTKIPKSSLGRSSSDVNPLLRPKRNSLFNIFKEKVAAQDLNAEGKKSSRSIVKRSKSDVTDLKSNQRFVRKRTGSESEEYLNSVVGKKSQLSPIIENTQGDDYFKAKNSGSVEKIVFAATPDAVELNNPLIIVSSPTPTLEYKVNPIEKPPRTKDPKPPTRIKRSKTLTGKDEHFQQAKNTVKAFGTLPKSKGVNQSKLFVDELDGARSKDHREVKKNIKEAISLLENKSQAVKSPDMIHSSQKPPEKLPLTKGHAVDTMVKILNNDKFSPPPKASLLLPPSVAAKNNNQPFSYTKPSVSPDPNLYARSPSPERPPSPINKTPRDAQGIIYAQVVCGNGESGSRSTNKQTVHSTINPGRPRHNNHSDEDEGLGYEENRLHASSSKYDQTDFSYSGQKIGDDPYRHLEDYHSEKDSPITPRFKEFRTHNFMDKDLDHANEYPPEHHYANYEDQRGRGDGMDARRRESLAEPIDSGYDKKKAELSYRRDMMESRIHARKLRDSASPGEFHLGYSPEKEYLEDPNPKEATEKYVAETTTRYFRNNDNMKSGYTDKYTSETKVGKDGTLKKTEQRSRSKYNPETSLFEPVPDEEIDRREFIDRRLAEEPNHLKYFGQKPARYFPPEPEYEPPSLDSQTSGPRYSPEVRKYKSKSSRHTSSHEGLDTTSRYTSQKKRQEKFANSKDHYASNPEIAQRIDFNASNDQYNPDKPETFHNSLRRQKQNKSDKHFTDRRDYLEQSSSRSLRQQDADGRRDLGYGGGDTSGPESSRSRYDNDRDRDNKLADSGIENDYRKDSNGEIHNIKRNVSSNVANSKFHHGSHARIGRNESDDEGIASSLLIASERQHTEENHGPRMRSSRDDFVHRERSIDDGSFFDPRIDKFDERSANRLHSKPPKSTKIISSLEKVKQLFSRDSSKKSKRDKEKRKMEQDRLLARERDRQRERERERDSMVREEVLRSRYKEYKGSGDESNTQELDYRHRHRLATPPPTPSPPAPSPLHRKGPAPQPPSNSNNKWFSSLTRKSNSSKIEKESVLTTTEEESNISPKRYSTNSKPPTKNLRFFGDTDQESNDSISKHQSTLKKRSQLPPRTEPRSLNRTGRNLSSSVHALDRSNKPDSKYKSSSMSNLKNFDENESSLSFNNANRRNLHNISEIHSNSETESIAERDHKRHDVLKERNYDDRKNITTLSKPPIIPGKEKKRSRSYSAAKSNGNSYSKSDLRDQDVRMSSSDLLRSKQDLRTSRQELANSRNELRSRGRYRVSPPGAPSPAESSTEGDSSHQSQRSVVYLHAATVGDIPGRSRVSRGRSRDDVSSVNSSRLQPQARTVTRSFSVLAPWKPRHYKEGYDINYSQAQHTKTLEKPPIASKSSKSSNPFSFSKSSSKSASSKNLSSSKYDLRPSDDRIMQKKTISSSTMPRRPHASNSSNIGSSSTLRKSSGKENLPSYNFGHSTTSRSRNDLRDKKEVYKKSMSTEVLSRDSPPKGTKRSSIERERLSRSISMPKDPNKSAGWFKITKKSKNAESTNRLY